MRDMKRLLTFICLAIGLLSCAPKQDNSTPEPADSIQLVGKWDICSIDSLDLLSINTNLGFMPMDQEEPEWHHFILQFYENGFIGASAGCNSIGGQYSFADDILKVSEMCRTEMYCEGLMDIEDAICEFLSIGDEMAISSYSPDSLLLTKQNNSKMIIRRVQ